MNAEICITALGERMDIKEAMRIYYAGLAMQAIIQTNESPIAGPITVAREAVYFADALINALAASKPA